MNESGQGFGRIALGIMLLVMGMAAFFEGFFLAIAMAGFGAYLLWQQYQQRGNGAGSFEDLWARLGEWFGSNRASLGNRTSTSMDYDADYEDPPSQPNMEKVYAHALRAVEQAGLNPDEIPVLPTDVGVIAFSGEDEQTVYRSLPVMDNVDFIQPYVQLRLPQKAIGKIKFEILDSDGQRLFVWEEQHQLQRGRNLITPSARLPIHDAHPMHNRWKLRVSADGNLLAEHRFEWAESDAKRVRRNLSEDGEISNELRASLADNRLGKLSLDELLAQQDADDGAGQQQMRR
jgi:hypothetical protein